MGRRNISDLQEYNEDSRGLFIGRTVRPHPYMQSNLYTPDKSELPEEGQNPRSHLET